jgi:hypothetical protein
MTTEADFTHRLTAEVPELQPLLDEHLADQEGELLPYLLMGDVAQWLHEHTLTEPRRVSEVLRWIEGEFVRGDFDVRNLIDVGIVEMLPAVPEGATVLDLLGPELRGRAQVAGLFADPSWPRGVRHPNLDPYRQTRLTDDGS